MQNIEAFSQGEQEEIHIWCCGNRDKCAIGDKVIIIGEMSSTPCITK